MTPQRAGGFSALPSGADPRTEHRTKGTDPRTGTRKAKSQTSLVSCFPPVLASCAGFLLVSGRWFFCPVPPRACLCFSSFSWPVVLSFIFLGATTQEPVQGTDPRTGVFRYPLTYIGFVCMQCVFNYAGLVYAYMLSLPLPEIDFCSLNGEPQPQCGNLIGNASSTALQSLREGVWTFP